MDFSRYQPPGVYVEDRTTAVVASGGDTPSLLALVGSSRGFRIGNEQIAIPEVDPVQLIEEGIDEATIVVTDTSGTEYVLDTDYTVTVDGSGTTATTEIARIDTGGIDPNETVFVSYEYTDEDYTSFNRFETLESVEDYYGPAVDLEAGEVSSPLTLAARIAFANGATEVGCLDIGATDPMAVTSSEISDSYSKLLNEPDISVVVPLPTGVEDGNTNVVGQDLASHVSNASLDGNYRTGVVGFDTNVTDDPATVADAVANQRVMLSYPNRLLFYNGQTGRSFEVGGQYLGAAYGGQLVSQSPAEPLTKNVIRGFAGIPAGVLSTMTRSAKNTWSQSGVAVSEQSRRGRLVVRHGVTTDPSNTLTRELSLVRAKDAMLFSLKDSMERSGLVGSAITQDTVLGVKAMASSSLETSMEAGLFVSYDALRVRQTTTNPSVVEIKFQYRPAYPLNYIVISFSLDVNSGEVAETPEAA